jgi:uncharacterized RDD family membrane protein YckC
MSVSSEIPAGEMVLAKWSTRFWAWLIDFVIVNIVLGAIFSAVALPFWLANPGKLVNDGGFGGPLGYGVTSLVFFIYWIYFESTTGQSLGKMALKIKSTDLSGGKADIKNVAIQSFGKAFLLPIDVVLGWIFTNDKRQRIFSRAGNIIVVRAARIDQNVNYKKE